MKHMRRFTALILALVMVFTLTATATAATAQTVTVKLSPNITVTLDGEPQAMADVKGNPVYPVLYGGTTYLPVRAVGNMLGLDVGWVQATQTVLLTTSTSTKPATSGSKAPSSAKPADITVQINPNITVKLDGKTQEMKDTNGNPVYPMLYGGTTYLPVRAVSNMLGVDVKWDQATQTVLLTIPYAANDDSHSHVRTYTAPDGREIQFDAADPEGARGILAGAGFSQDEIDQIMSSMTEPDYRKDGQTSVDATMLGNKHIGNDWAEIDWSTANKGYVRVKVAEDIAEYTSCDVACYATYFANGIIYTDGTEISGLVSECVYQSSLAKTDGWCNVPLSYSNGEYECVVAVNYMHNFADKLQARFTAQIDIPDSMWLMSSTLINYETAPNACAKAKELTRNCKTDAEKITAIYNFVSKTITYDGVNGFSVGLHPDSILAAKRGVCQHYAMLMTAMLRSVGVPCKLVTGSVNFGDGWSGHDWVAVKPETGTLSIPGMGKDYTALDENGRPANPTGWIRLDPTNAHAPNKTSNDNIYHSAEYR